ncbi:MAG: hypothetical protein OHK0035_27580 [Cyanobacteria bacterium J069]
MHYVIGIDLGGTAIKLGRYDSDGRCAASLTVPTPQPPEPERVLDAMVTAIAQIDPNNEAIAIGMGTPGPADAAGRVARVAINLGWQEVPLADWLEAKTGKPTVLANDANCAGLGEAWLGAGRSFRDMILLTLGTGVGGAIVLDGRLFAGRQGTGGELGLITLNPQGPECNSGNRGSLEQYCSVQAIRRRTGLEPGELGRRARAGDPEAIAFWQEYGRDLGAGIASLVYILTPEAVILSGGVSASFEFFYPTLWEELQTRVLPSSREGLQVLPAALGNQAGEVGAAKLAWGLVREQGLGLDEERGRGGDEERGRGGDEERGREGEKSALRSSSPHPLIPSSNSDTPLHQMEMAYWLASEQAQFHAGFLARTSHELRSPINGVIGLQQLILNDLCDSPEEEREFVRQANDAAQKMLALMDQAIAISRIQQDFSKLDIQPVQLAGTFLGVQDRTQLLARNRNLRLDIVPPASDYYVLADPQWLQQVLVSLVSGAIASMRDGTIRLTTNLDTASKLARLILEDTRPAESWQEPVEQLANFAHRPEITRSGGYMPLGQLSPGLTLLAFQSILEAMDGRLELVDIPTDVSPLSRLQMTLPLIQEED